MTSMSQLDALSLTETIKRRLVDYSLDEHFTRDQSLREICRKIWSGPPAEGGLVSDIWVEGAFGAKPSADTLSTLVAKGVVHKELPKVLGPFPADRPLYEHQAEAIIRAAQPGPRPAVVVTAGTGAGKTESFLLPVLNDLVAHPGKPGDGMRCLILYPMNALVNDQVERLYDWLKPQVKVSLFHFTSETPEDKRAADRAGVEKFEPCRRRTRQEARQDPPDIVITNYSMLEYMLCRPQDAPFFGPGLRAVVLDEAHLYTGTLAAEITLLLRRLLLRCGLDSTDVLQMATSATLGTQALDDFAATIFSKPKSLVHVIEGQSHRLPLARVSPPATPPTPAAVASIFPPQTLQLVKDQLVFVQDPVVAQQLATDLAVLATDAAPPEAEPARVLHRMLGQAPKVHDLEDILWQEKRLSLPALSTALWGSDDPTAERATVRLLQTSAAARRDAGDRPLVAHRIHVLTRAADGLNVCLNSACTAPADQKLEPFGAVQAGGSLTCRWCESATLSLYRCFQCGQEVLAGHQDVDHVLPVLDPDGMVTFLSPAKPDAHGDKAWDIDPANGEARGAAARGLALYPIERCPNCDIELRRNPSAFANGRPFSTANQVAISIVVESALAELPPFPSHDAAWLPGRGRRLLAFSDSRSGAARLGTRLSRQHEKMLMRAAITQVIENNPVDTFILGTQQAEVARWQAELAKPGLTPQQQAFFGQKLSTEKAALKKMVSGGAMKWWADQLEKSPAVREILDLDGATKHSTPTWTQTRWDDNWKAVANDLLTRIKTELALPTPRDVLQGSGLVEVTYPGLDSLTVPADLVGVLPTDGARQALSGCWADVLALLCDSLRRDGVVSLGSAREDDEWPSEGVPTARWTAATGENWDVLRFVGQTDAQTRMRFAADVLERCQAPRALAAQLLGSAFDLLQKSGLPWIENETRQTKNGPAPAFRIRMSELAARIPLDLFQCKNTMRVTTRHALGCAPGLKGPLQPVTAAALDADPRHGRSRTEIKQGGLAFAIALWAEEHSAQLSPRENRRLQDLFKAGIRNLLSSTTTLELGIDIGGLNAVFLSNVPPGLANYLQRAGRAGRRADGSSVVITFVRPRPFDREVFVDFGKYLGRSLRRPRVMLERTRVVRRHVHALLLGDFFRRIYPPGTHVGAMNAFGNVGTFAGVVLPPYWEDGPKPLVAPLLPDWDIPSNEAWAAVKQANLADYFTAFARWAETDGQCQSWAKQLLDNTGLQGEPFNATIDTLIKQFTESVTDWTDEYSVLYDSWDKVTPGQSAPPPRPMANSLHYQMQALHETTVIETFADKQFLPRYGFPIGLQKLRVIKPDEKKPERSREEDQYRLERSGLLALREYVPGSQMLVGGHVVTSHGLLKHWTGATVDSSFGVRGQYAKCKNQHCFYTIAGVLGDCPVCGEPPKGMTKDMLLVRHGFSGAAWDPPRRGHDVERVGETERATIAFTAGSLATFPDFAGVAGLTLKYREDGELLVLNTGANERGFALCLKCGFSESEIAFDQGAQNLPSHFAHHAPLQRSKPNSFCWGAGDAPVLRNRVLAAKETTDILLMDFTGCLGDRVHDQGLMQALGTALKLAGARILDLDARELGVMVDHVGVLTGFSIVLHDNVPGGAGHVRELVEIGRPWFEAARQALYVDALHDSRCTRACLDCLLTFDIISESVVPDRREALQVLDALLAGGVPGGPSGGGQHLPAGLTGAAATASPPAQAPQGGSPAASRGSVEERLARADARRRGK